MPLLAGLTAWQVTGSVATGLGAAGLVLDIIGVWLLTEGLTLSDTEAEYFGSHGRLGNERYLAKRNSRQARIGLVVAVFGFILQGVGLVAANWPTPAA